MDSPASPASATNLNKNPQRRPEEPGMAAPPPFVEGSQRHEVADPMTCPCRRHAGMFKRIFVTPTPC